MLSALACGVVSVKGEIHAVTAIEKQIATQFQNQRCHFSGNFLISGNLSFQSIFNMQFYLFSTHLMVFLPKFTRFFRDSE